MKTLSDDLTIQVRTTGMSEGYVTTNIRKDNNVIFSGRSYIPGDNSSLNININDFAAQNRNKYDFLKLNDDGKLESTPIKNVSIGGISEQTRFVPGQISLYNVIVADSSNSYMNFSYCFTGYEYPNKDIKPSIIENDYDSLIGRVMQGCDWGYNPEEIQSSWFHNLLIPRYPLKFTKKYGMGIQLYTTKDATYYLRTSAGDASTQLKLGWIEEVTGNQMFITLEDLYYSGVAVGYGSEFYLKQASNDDAFGKLVDVIYYKTKVKFDTSINVEWVNRNDESTIEILTNQSPNFESFLTRYVNYSGAGWDIETIVADGTAEVYDTGWQEDEYTATVKADEYKDEYGAKNIPLTPLERLAGYKRITVTPYYSNEDAQYTQPKYIGNCPIAKFDECTARYYLAWNDRFGDIQSQPFNGKVEYSENIDTEEIIDYKMRRRPSNKQVQPKWKLNTTWLNPKVYPMYESIFISPYLLLYDTEQDKAWNVIVKDSEYKEKTYKNQKGLFNLEITVEANTTQNYIF